jgi:hypothetical protein
MPTPPRLRLALLSLVVAVSAAAPAQAAPRLSVQAPVPVAQTTRADLAGALTWSGASGCSAGASYGCPARFTITGTVAGKPSVAVQSHPLFWSPALAAPAFADTEDLSALSRMSPPYAIQLTTTDGSAPGAPSYSSPSRTFRWPVDRLTVDQVQVGATGLIGFDARPTTAFREGKVSVTVSKVSGSRARRLGSFSASARQGRTRLHPPRRIAQALRRTGSYRIRIALKDEWERHFTRTHSWRIVRVPAGS